ncbi:hypothetical protein BASA81_002952 [Batrachochytrium salamandrivorans]|nr:hypothetical protein BASA81_002952 [Batrachochytrium salamandrivorans]
MLRNLLVSRRGLLTTGSLVGAGMMFNKPAACLSTASTALPAITLYQYQVCPYCNKLQTYLEYHKIPHKRVEVNPLSKKEMKFSEYKKVPFVVVATEGQQQQVNGSDAVIDWVSKEVLHESAVSQGVQQWRTWADDVLIHLLPPNIYRTPGESLQAFEYISNSSNFSAMEKFTAKYTGALAMYFIAKRSLTKYNIKDARLELQQALDKWSNEALPPTAKFHGGAKPDMADLSVYGVVRSIEGNYSTWNDMQAKVDPKFWAWYSSMKQEMSPPILLD